MPGFVRRLCVLPFEVAMAVLVFFSGMASLLHLSTTVDALTQSFPGWLVVALNVMYCLSGLTMFAGIGTARRDLEGSGVVLLGSAVVVRFIAVVASSGFIAPVFVQLMFYAGVVTACGIRLKHLVQGSQLILVSSGGMSGQTRDIDAEDLHTRDQDSGEDPDEDELGTA